MSGHHFMVCVRIVSQRSPILQKNLSGLSDLASAGIILFPFLAMTLSEFENFRQLRSFCPDNASTFFEKIQNYVRI